MTSPAAAFDALRRGLSGVQGPPPGTFTLGPPVVIDSLGAETAAQRTERKAAEREAFPGWLHVIGTALTFLIVAGVFAAVGTVIGNQRNSDVTDLWKFVPSPSGERAEPEESAR